MTIRIRCNRFGYRVTIADERGFVLHESTVCGTYLVEIPSKTTLFITVTPIGENLKMTNYYHSIQTECLTSVFLFPTEVIQPIKLYDRTYHLPVDGILTFISKQ